MTRACVVDALDGAPGIYSARYCEGTDEDRNAFLLKIWQDKENRACRFVCAIACVLADGETLTVRGECEGELLRENHGAGGFGYDPAVLCREIRLYLRRTVRRGQEYNLSSGKCFE